RWGLRSLSERGFNTIRAIYARSLRWVLQHPTLMLLIFAGTVALNVSLYISIPKGFLPEQDTGQLNGFVRGDDASSFQVTHPRIDAYRQLLLGVPGIADVSGMSGGGDGTSNGYLTTRQIRLAECAGPASEVVVRLRRSLSPVAGGNLWLSV